MSNEGDRNTARLFIELEMTRVAAEEADSKAEAGLEGLERQGNPHALLEEAPRPGYPFGAEYPFGISISGAVVTVYPQIVYHGGTALETEQTDVTILADKDWIIIEFDPDASTPAVVVKQWTAASGLPRDHDGLLVRGIWRFALAGEEGAEAASLDRAGWSPGNLAMMAEDGT